MKEEPAEPKHIMVVDDDDQVRILISHLLKREGYHPINAANGQDALEYLRRSPALPDLILLDLRMPVMDGWQFRTIQKADPRLAAIPVVVITTLDTVENDVQSIQAAAYCRKPVDAAILVKTIRDHCG
ncbi:MAG: hypothetical protein A2583_07785 [Bdellovibrionales bacterium RIFOXYD1_FULL_53_11]|nr:MAG: hypothetical protein A2583_07785 [Bdellovibrionales bacterium RIFOXYD1_FULL_53_11]